MAPDEPYTVDFPIVVPQRLRHLLNSHLRSTTRIVISEQVSEGKTRKVNSLRLTNTTGGFPQESLDDIAEAVVAIMHIAWRDQETKDDETESSPPSMDFVITCEHYQKRPGNEKPKRVRDTFTYLYRGADDDGDDAEEEWTMEERAIQRAMETLERQNASLIGHVDLLHTTILTFFRQQSDAATAQGAASAETMKQAIPMFFSGVQQSLNAKYLEYSHAKAEADAKASTDKFVGSLKAVAPFLGMAASQFLAHRFKLDPSAFAGLLNQFGLGDDAPAAAPAASSSDAGEDPPGQLVAFFAGELGRSLSNAQRREIGRRFTTEQVLVLDDLFCADTDAEALAAYNVVVEKVGQQLVVLQGMLDADQRETLSGFMQALQRYATTLQTAQSGAPSATPP